MEARILQARNRHQDRLDLIKILKTLESQHALRPEEMLLLARTYDQTDQWPNVRRVYQDLLRSHEDDPEILSRFAYGLIAHHELDKAQNLLQNLKRQRPDSFAVTRLEASLQHAQGERETAVRTIQRGLENLHDADSPDRAVADLLLAGKLEEALGSLETDARKHNDREAVSALQEVRELLAKGHSEEAAENLRRQLLTSAFQFQLQVFQLKAAAKLLEGWGDLAAAEAVLRRIVETSPRPEEALPLISNLARQGRVEQALELCQKAWETCPVESVAPVCVAIIRTGKASAQEAVMAEAQLQAAVQQHPHSIELQVRLADLRDFQGRYDEAEQIYRAILKNHPHNVMALNNLAWLIAIRGNTPDVAFQHINRAIRSVEKRVGPVPELLDTRAVVSLQAGKPQAALIDLNKAVNVSATPPPAHLFPFGASLPCDGKRNGSQTDVREGRSVGRHQFAPIRASRISADRERLQKSLTISHPRTLVKAPLVFAAYFTGHPGAKWGNGGEPCFNPMQLR